MGNGENQDNPEPMIDFEALQRYDPDEWDRAEEILGLWDIALKSVKRHIGSKFPSEVEDIAIKAFEELYSRAIDGVDNLNGIVPMLRTICWNRSFDFLRREYRRYFEQFEEEIHQDRLNIETSNWAEILDKIAEAFGKDSLTLEQFVNFLAEKTCQNPLHVSLLKNVIAGDLKQREFAVQYHIRLGTIGGLKSRLLKQIRRFLIENLPPGWRFS